MSSLLGNEFLLAVCPVSYEFLCVPAKPWFSVNNVFLFYIVPMEPRIPVISIFLIATNFCGVPVSHMFLLTIFSR